MQYKSTRDTRENPVTVSSAEAIKEGLAPDGGLYIPLSFPALSDSDFDALIKMSYPERAADILSRFLDDYDKDALLSDCREAYSEVLSESTLPISIGFLTYLISIRLIIILLLL